MRDDDTPAWTDDDWAGVRVRVGLSPERPQPWL